MDEKKVREAIELIRMEINTLEGIENCGRIIEARKKKHIALHNIAIKALEKQLPKKPEEVVSAIYGASHECKNCGSEIEPLDIYADYCKWCGQRLDWTESYARFIQDSNKS